MSNQQQARLKGWVALFGLLAWVGWRFEPQLFPPADPSWMQVQSSRVLRFGLDATLPPFSFLDSDAQYQGLEIDLARALATELDLQAQFDLVSYDGLYNVLQTERVDIAMSGLVANPSRSQDFTYLPAYFNAGLVLIRPASSLGALTTVAESRVWLAHKTLAVELGSQADVLARFWQKRVVDLQVVALDSPDAVLQAVKLKAVDAGFLSTVQAATGLRSEPAAHWQVLPVQDAPYQMVVRSIHWQLAQALTHALDRLAARGVLEEQRRTWLGWVVADLRWAGE